MKGFMIHQHLTASVKFLASNPSVLLRALIPIIVVVIVGILLFVLLMALALRPQAQEFINLIGEELTWLAWIIAVILVLLETAFGILLLSFLLLERLSDRVFDIVLKQKCPDFQDSPNTSRLKETRDDVREMLLFLSTLPLNVIPVVGTMAFVGINGYISGPFIHTRQVALLL